MKFPNAHAGVKKLFICEIIAVAASVLTIVGAILAAIGLKNGALLTTAGGIILGSTIALVVVFILQLVGMHQAGKDEIQLKYAFCATVLGVLIGVVASILGSFKQTTTISLVTTFLDAGQSVAVLFASYYVLMGISTLAGKLNDGAMQAQGKRLANWVIIFFLISIGFEILGVILKTTSVEWLKTVAAILAIAAGVAELVVYIITFVYYGKAVKMLKK